MANPKGPAVTQPAPTIKVRCKVELFGSMRDPQARRGDVLEMTRDEFEKHGPDVFEDIEAAEKLLLEAQKPTNNIQFQIQKDALRADRESAAQAFAIKARNEAKRAAEIADAAEQKLKG